MPEIPRPLLTLAMPSLYVVPNWDRDFENARSAQVENTKWFLCPNHFDGKKIRRLQGLKKAPELYGIFHAILAIASKCPYRGVLLDQDGPIGATDLAAKTGFHANCFVYALAELTKPGIGLLERHEIEEKDGFWELPETVKRWAVHSDSRRRARDASSPARPAEAPRGPARPTEDLESPRSPRPINGNADSSLPGSGAHVGSARPTEAPRGPARPTEAANGSRNPPEAARVLEGKGREGNRREESPLPSPNGGQSADNRISNSDLAKRLICEKILGGKDPARPWSYQAQERLSTLCGAGGIPLQEIEEIATYRSIAKSDDIPELKARRDPITETSLMEYWGDEAQRAHAYLEKYRSNRNGLSEKKEPPNWREFFHWKWGPDCLLPPSFWKLDDDQKKEWEREHEEFDARPQTEIAV